MNPAEKLPLTIPSAPEYILETISTTPIAIDIPLTHFFVRTFYFISVMRNSRLCNGTEEKTDHSPRTRTDCRISGRRRGEGRGRAFPLLHRRRHCPRRGAGLSRS